MIGREQERRMLNTRRMVLSSKSMFKISLFGWEVVLLRYPKVTEKQKGIGIQVSGAYIKQEGNFLIACNDKGEYIPKQISLTISDNVNEISTVTVEYFFAGIYSEVQSDKLEEQLKI